MTVLPGHALDGARASRPGVNGARAMVRKARASWDAGTLTIPAHLFVIVYLFLLLCIPSQLIVRPLGAPGTPANLWAMFTLLWWILTTLGGRNPVRGFTVIRVTLGLLTLAVLASYVAGNSTGWYSPAGIHQSTDEVYSLVTVSAGELNERMTTAADRGLLSFAGWAGIVLVTSEGLRSSGQLDRIVNWAVGFGTFVAALGIVQYFTGFDIAALFTIPGLSANSDFGTVDTRSVLNRVSGTAVHPIEFGVLLAAIFMFALHRSLFSPTRSSISRWLPTAVIGIALPMSVSRSAILAVAIGILIMFAGWPGRWRLKALVVAPFAVVGIRLLAPGLVGTIRSLFANVANDPSISGRTGDYSAIFGLYGEHPILGRGLFTLVPRYYRILDNQMLMTLVELGLVGLICVLIFIAASVQLTRSARRRLPEGSPRHLALVISGAIVGVVVSYLTFDAWGFPMVAGITFFLVGMAGAVHNLAPDERARPAAR